MCASNALSLSAATAKAFDSEATDEALESAIQNANAVGLCNTGYSVLWPCIRHQALDCELGGISTVLHCGDLQFFVRLLMHICIFFYTKER
jgi:hypothetical protein